MWSTTEDILVFYILKQKLTQITNVLCAGFMLSTICNSSTLNYQWISMVKLLLIKDLVIWALYLLLRVALYIRYILCNQNIFFRDATK